MNCFTEINFLMTICLFERELKNIYVCVFVRLYVCVFVCLYVCVYLHVRVLVYRPQERLSNVERKNNGKTHKI